MSNKISYNEIRNLNEDWSLDERNNKPYSGDSVQKFLKRVLLGKAGDFYYDSDTTKYLVFADSESRNTYLSDREEHADLVLGTFDAPANYSAEITMQTSPSNVILSGSTGNYIDFTFDIKSKTGSSTGESVIATYTFNNAGNVKKVTQIYNAGDNVHFLVDSYISEGTNNVSVVITGRNTLVSTMSAINFTVVALSLTSDFDFSSAVEVGNYLSVPYTLEGAGVKYVQWYIDGVLQQSEDTITDLRVNRTKNIDTTGMSTGKHNVQARAYITSGSDHYYSNVLYYYFVVCPVDELWSSTSTYVLLGVVLAAPTNGTLSVSITQYGNFNYQAAIYDSSKRSLNMSIKDNGTQIQSMLMQPDQVEDLTYSPITTGTHTLSFTIGESTASITTTVLQGEVDIEEATDALVLRLSAKGRSNNESTPGTWTYNDITTTFNNFAWNQQSGWNDNCLIIPAGSSIDINLAPLSNNPVSTGKTIEIDYETIIRNRSNRKKIDF